MATKTEQLEAFLYKMHNHPNRLKRRGEYKVCQLNRIGYSDAVIRQAECEQRVRIFQGGQYTVSWKEEFVEALKTIRTETEFQKSVADSRWREVDKWVVHGFKTKATIPDNESMNFESAKAAVGGRIIRISAVRKPVPKRLPASKQSRKEYSELDKLFG